MTDILNYLVNEASQEERQLAYYIYRNNTSSMVAVAMLMRLHDLIHTKIAPTKVFNTQDIYKSCIYFGSSLSITDLMEVLL